MSGMPAAALLERLEEPISRRAGPIGRLILRKKSRELGLRTGIVDEEKARTLMFELGSAFFVILGEETGVATLARIRETMVEMGLDV
ncbi:MAG TPA: hypothetical protein VI893_04205 [Thermoplasmata archaeon]|nr:hypothetical protein [Thermoplasmata archaeon]